MSDEFDSLPEHQSEERPDRVLPVNQPDEYIHQIVSRASRRCRLSDEHRTRLLDLSRRDDDGSLLLDEIEHLRAISFLDGAHEAVGTAINVVHDIGRVLRPIPTDNTKPGA